MKREEILKALEVIKNVCYGQYCMNCPFYLKNNGCYIISDYPYNWEIQEENDIWRAFYD